MSKKTKRRRIVLSALAILALVSLFAITFHHHEFQDQHTNDCSVCIFVRTAAFLFVISAALAAATLLFQLAFTRFSSIFHSRACGSALRERAPPVPA